MSPENANIIYIEDKAEWIARTKETLEQSGHHVIALASSLDAGMELIQKLAAEGTKVDIALIDDDLKAGKINGVSNGALLASAVRAYLPQTKVLGYSAGYPTPWSDRPDISKFSPQDVLLEAIKSL